MAGSGGVRRTGADARRAPPGRRCRRALRRHPGRRAPAGDPAAARERRKGNACRIRTADCHRRRHGAVGRIRQGGPVFRRHPRRQGRKGGLAGPAGGTVGRPAGRSGGGHGRGRTWGAGDRARSTRRRLASRRRRPVRRRKPGGGAFGGARPRAAVPAMAVGAAWFGPAGDRNAQRGIRAGRRSRAGAGLGRRRRQPFRTARAVSARPRSRDAARTPITLCRNDRRILPNRRGAGHGAQSVGTRPGGAEAGRAVPGAACDRAGRERLHP